MPFRGQFNQPFFSGNSFSRIPFSGFSITERALAQADSKTKAAGMRTVSGLAIRILVLLIAMSSALLWAQSASGNQNPSGEPEGITSGGYLIHSSVELGYRTNDINGSGDMYDTLVNLQTGPRFLDETLSMQSVDHQGMLFDDLSLNSFGWGGDPNNALRIRVEKNKWYDFVGSFRRDQYFSDFDLLDNPLNPSTSTPSIPVENSPHLFDTVRRMSDVDLTLLPQSRISFRVGFSHNNMTGPSYSSIHEGTEALLFQDWNTTMNSYRLGADWRFAPRTVLSYDQFLDYYKGDTDYQLAPFAPVLLSTGTPVELGLSIDTANNEPCAVPKGSTSLVVNGVLTNNTCSAYFGYSRNQRVRTSYPTESVRLRSNYLQRLDVIASYSYTSADMTTPLDENFAGLITRTHTLAFTGTGAGGANEISNVFDFEATLHLTRHLRLIEKFHLWDFRSPENANYTEIDSDCTNTSKCNLLTPLSATAPTTVTTTAASSFNQDWTRNQTELAWDISQKVGTRVGFRYGDQTLNDFTTYMSGGLNHIDAEEYTGLFGFWARPTHDLRLNFDAEHSNYNDVFFRISPRKESRYRVQTTYTPRPWAVVGGSINILRDANADAFTQYVGHNQNFGLTASITPRQRVGFDLAYNFNGVMQNGLICFADTPPAGVTLPFVSSSTACPGPQPLPPSNNLLNTSYYDSHINFAMATVRVKPVKRVTTNVGYNINAVDGRVPQFNILQPLGTTQYKFQQPVANLSVDIGHKFAYNMGWNYYQYNEGSPDQSSFVGPTAPRYFHANAITESLRYSF